MQDRDHRSEDDEGEEPEEAKEEREILRLESANERRVQRIQRSRQWLSAAILLGVLFCVIKVFEYTNKFAAGITPETNAFFGFYYGLTAFHFAHVVFGLALLGLVSWRTSTENVETAAAFWHMVDLIWILLYPLIYLLR